MLAECAHIGWAPKALRPSRRLALAASTRWGTSEHARHGARRWVSATPEPSPGRAWWENAALNLDPIRRLYQEKGFVHLRWAFLDVAACREVADEALRARGDSDVVYHSYHSHTVYQEDPDPSLPLVHCRNAMQASEKYIIDFKRLPDRSPVRALYFDERLLRLVQDIVGIQELHLSGDPYNSAYLNIFEEGHGLGWHFDSSEFGVNLLLSPPQVGGCFEIHKGTRTPEEPRAYDAVSAVLEQGSQHPEVHVVDDCGPGDLVIFSGRWNMHRVTPVSGTMPRVNAIFTYEKDADVRASPYTLRTFFGRT